MSDRTGLFKMTHCNVTNCTIGAIAHRDTNAHAKSVIFKQLNLRTFKTQSVPFSLASFLLLSG